MGRAYRGRSRPRSAAHGDGRSSRVDPPHPGWYRRAMKWKAYGRYGSLGIELIVSMAVGYFIGKWLDERVGARGWLTGLFTLAGVYAGFRALFKAAKQMERDVEKEEKLERGQAPWKVPMPDGYEDDPPPPKAPAAPPADEP